MKHLAVLVFCLLFVSPGRCQSTQEKFKAAEAQAPKGYPTLFVVRSAASVPSTFLGTDGGCSMDLETLGQVYSVSASQGFKNCKAFTPGTVVYGRVHNMLSQVVDILDTSGGKPKSRRYFVQAVQMVNPAQQ